MNPRGRGLVENEEQGKNQKMKSIVVEEQEQEQEQDEGSETRFVDLDEDTLLNVLERVDVVTLGRAACVNKLWSKVARDERLWEPIVIKRFINSGTLEHVDRYRNSIRSIGFHKVAVRFNGLKPKPPPLDFYSIDPQDFSRQIRPWVQKKYKIPVEVAINPVLLHDALELLLISRGFADDSRTDMSVFWLVDSHPDAPVAAVLCALYA